MELQTGSQASQQQQQEDIDAALASFRARCDLTDPQQAALLAEMEAHTRRLHQARGDWEKPNNRRNWNSAARGERAQPPAAIESFREYKMHIAAEQQRQRQLQQPSLLLLDSQPEASGAATDRTAAQPTDT